MSLSQRFRVCDCHRKVFGPCAWFSRRNQRTSDPPESPNMKLVASSETSGVMALITDGGMDDFEDLGQIRLPVWSRCIPAKGDIRVTFDVMNICVVCASATVNAGAGVVAEDDRLVVIFPGRCSIDTRGLSTTPRWG